MAGGRWYSCCSYHGGPEPESKREGVARYILQGNLLLTYSYQLGLITFKVSTISDQCQQLGTKSLVHKLVEDIVYSKQSSHKEVGAVGLGKWPSEYECLLHKHEDLSSNLQPHVL